MPGQIEKSYLDLINLEIDMSGRNSGGGADLDWKPRGATPDRLNYYFTSVGTCEEGEALFKIAAAYFTRRC